MGQKKRERTEEYKARIRARLFRDYITNKLKEADFKDLLCRHFPEKLSSNQTAYGTNRQRRSQS